MPTFSGPPGGGLDVLASAALAHVGESAPTAAVAAPRVSTGVAGTDTSALSDLPDFDLVPAKLIKRIWDLEYIDMAELLPESWRVEAVESSCCHAKRPRRELILDFALWTECYATLSAILSARYPSKAPHLAAYLRIITNASRNFEGSAWASYDAAFRRQAANRRSLDWGRVHQDLYSQAFTGRARLAPRCRYCLGGTHSSADCTFAPTDSRQPVRPAGQATLSIGRQPMTRPQSSAVEICRLYNHSGGNQCRYPACRYAHLCSRCHRPHSAAECDKRKPTASPSSATPAAPARP